MRAYLEAHPEYGRDGSWVLAVDARDSFFQRDPFAFPRGAGDELFVFYEGDGARQLQNSPWNLDVIQRCYDDATVQRVGASMVSCSGSVMGSYRAMLEYLRLMEAEILETVKKPGCNDAGGRDQGFHNVILAERKLEARGVAVTGFANPSSALVATLGDGQTFRDVMGRVLTERGEVVALVHQWDRRPEIKDIIDAQMFPTFLSTVNLPPGYPDMRRSAAELGLDHGGVRSPPTAARAAG
jgi:hypothetical protein